MSKFIQIDEEGYFLSTGTRVTDEVYGNVLMQNLYRENRIYKTKFLEQEIYIEAFDDPFVARGVSQDKSKWFIELPYGFRAQFKLDSLLLDEWDRFHGRTVSDVAFVFSRPAQMKFFDLIDSFDDESFTVENHVYAVQNVNDKDLLLRPPTATTSVTGDVDSEKYWSDRYLEWKQTGAPPGWELNEPAKPLLEVLPQIKLPRSKICVLGCGTGQDAAYLAKQGHIVTGIDLSREAIEKAQHNHKGVQNLNFEHADAFEFAQKNAGQFDIVFEHTFYCAITPLRRDELIHCWRKLLAEGGQLLGIFFILDRIGGPPFGTTEWELRQRLKKHFDFLYWTRWKTSIPARQGAEHVILAKRI